MFFSDDLPEERVRAYQAQIAASSAVRLLDLKLLKQSLPIRLRDGLPPVTVIGSGRDTVVDREGVEEAAAFYGVTPKLLDVAHDSMLDTNWEAVARAIHEDLERGGGGGGAGGGGGEAPPDGPIFIDNAFG